VAPITTFITCDRLETSPGVFEDIKCVMLPYRYAVDNFRDRVIPPLEPPPVKFEFVNNTNNPDLRAEQVPVVEQALKDLDDYSTTTLNVRTAFGKTVCSYYIASKIMERTLILLTGDTIQKGWVTAGAVRTNAKIGVVESFKWTTSAFTKEECIEWLQNKELNPKSKRKIKEGSGIYNSLLYLSKQHGLISDELYGYDINSDILICMKDRYKHVPQPWPYLLIIDEADTFCCRTGVEAILWFRPAYVMILTATYEKENNTHKILEYIGGAHKIVRELHLNYKVFKFETGFKPVREFKDDFRLDWDAYQKSVISDPDRIEQIMDFINQNVDVHKILVLSSYKAIIDSLENYLKVSNIKYDVMMGNKKTYSDSNVLLGTIGKLGRGFDEENACDDFGGIRINLLLITTTFQSFTLYTQTVGRVMRSCNPVVVHMVDDDKTAEKHWNKACKFYEKSGAEIVTMVQ
jgi:superfamily II DNA or RNA helicase